MWRARIIVPLIALSCAVSSAPSQPPLPNAGGYQPIPPGFDFPADEAQQLSLRDTQDVAGMRRHAWMVFAGATQRAPGGEAIWETWFPSSTTFSSGPQLQGAGTPPARRFQPVRQHELTGLPQLQAPGASLLSSVMFNQPAHNHIRSQGLFRQQRLTQINNGFSAGTPVEQRQIAPFPRDAVSLKLVWTTVRANGLTPLRVWDGRGNPNSSNFPQNWPRVVLVDPSRPEIPENETRDVTVGGIAFPNSHVVPLNRFYSFRISQAEIAAVRRIEPQASVGDHAVLLAMHVTTKEIPDWVWATFWWHDRPDQGPFALDRPAAVTGVWRNYVMDVAYSMEMPLEYDGTPNSAFNPYLEAFARGMQSNCMTCHQGAVWTPQGAADFMPVTRGPRRPDDPLFRTGTRLDFLWSVAFESVPPG